MTTSITCPTCLQPAQRLPVVEGRAAGTAARVRVADLRVVHCRDNGHLGLAPRDIADRAAVVVAETLVHASRRRLRRTDHCGDCGEELTLAGRRTEVPVPVTVADGTVLVLVDTDMVRCPACGREQVPVDAGRELGRLVEHACADALTTAREHLAAP